MYASRSRVVVGAWLIVGLTLISAAHSPVAGQSKNGEGKSGDPKAGTTAVTLPPVFAKDQPESIADLKAIEQQVQEVLPKITPAVVGVRIGGAQGSGVIVSKDGYVLTAGHVSGQPGRKATVILPDGTKLNAKTLGKNGGIDSGMIKITDPGEWPHVEMGKSSALKKGQWVMAIGHPGGFRPNRTPVVRLGRVLMANPFVIQTDCTLVGGDSGGPLFDMSGQIIGIHSRIGPKITENIHVPVDTYRQTWDRLAKAESFGGELGQQAIVQSAGGKIIYEKEGRLTPDDPRDKKEKDAYAQIHVVKMAPGSDYTIDMTSPNGKKRLDPFLRLEDSAGKELAENDDGGGNLNARIVFRPTKEGEYRVIATSFAPPNDQTGPYKLVVRQAEVKMFAGKVDVLPAVKMPKQVAPLIVGKATEAGGVLFAKGTLFDAKNQVVVDKPLAFQWDKGEARVNSDDHGGIRLKLSKENVRQLFLNVPPGLKVALQLTDGAGNPFTLNLGPGFEKEKLKSAGGKLVLQEEGRLTPKEPTDAVRKDCYFKVHTFKMLPGFTYTIDLESPDFDAFLRLENPSGKQIAEDDDSAGKLNARILYTPETEGAYRIIVTTCDPEQFGSYRLSIYQTESKRAASNRAADRTADRAVERDAR